MISGPISDDDLLQFEHWMRVRVKHGHDPTDVIFWPPLGKMSGDAARAKRCQQAERLEKDVYVGDIYYYCRDNPDAPDSELYVSACRRAATRD
jgi:hypothetical protein